MQTEICEAIRGRRMLTFIYAGAYRSVEPHLLGYDSDGDLTLSAWQRSGGSGEGFRDFHASKLSGLSTIDETFSGPRAGYNPWDETIDQVVCRLCHTHRNRRAWASGLGQSEESRRTNDH